MRFTIDLELHEDGAELTDEEREYVHKRVAEMSALMAVAIRPLGRGKGYGILLTPGHMEVTWAGTNAIIQGITL